MILVRVNANIPWMVTQGTTDWVAICDPLKLTVQAETYSDLMESIGETLDAVLSDLLATNELDRFLSDHGWKLITPLPEKRKNLRFDVPFIPAIMGTRDPYTGVHQ